MFFLAAGMVGLVLVVLAVLANLLRESLHAALLRHYFGKRNDEHLNNLRDKHWL